MKEHWQKLQEWWSPLAVREKRAVMVAGAALALFIIYAGIWSPLMNQADLMRKRIGSEQKNLVWMQAADKSLQKIETQTRARSKTISPVVMLTLMQKKTEQAGLGQYMTQLKQSSSDAINIQFKKVEFDKLLEMLITTAKEQPVEIAQLSIAAQKPGWVDADIILKSA